MLRESAYSDRDALGHEVETTSEYAADFFFFFTNLFEIVYSYAHVTDATSSYSWNFCVGLIIPPVGIMGF